MRLCGKGRKAVVSCRLPVFSCDFRTDYWQLATGNWLVLDQPHGPGRDDYSANEKSEAVRAVAHHIARGIALGDAENRRGTEREQQGGVEVREFEGHCFLPIAMW